MAKEIISVNFKDYSKKILEAKEIAVARALIKIGIKAERFAKEDCPVDTGRLRNSISHAQKRNTLYVGTNVEYAPKQEFYHESKSHFLRNSITNHNELYKAIAEKELKT